MTAQRLLWWALGSAGAMVLGAFGPWAKVLFVTVNGTDGSNDGWWVVLLAVAGGLAVWWATTKPSRQREAALAALAAGVVASALTIADRGELEGVGLGAVGEVRVGWGLNLATIGSLSLVGAAVVLLSRIWRERPERAAPRGQPSPSPPADVPLEAPAPQPALGRGAIPMPAAPEQRALPGGAAARSRRAAEAGGPAVGGSMDER
jgi:hypothetical protein